MHNIKDDDDDDDGDDDDDDDDEKCRLTLLCTERSSVYSVYIVLLFLFFVFLCIFILWKFFSNKCTIHFRNNFPRFT